MGSLPYVPHPRNDTKRGRKPPFGNPHRTSQSPVRRWKLPGRKGGSLFGEGAEPP